MELVNRSAIPVNIRIIVEHALKRIERSNRALIQSIEKETDTLLQNTSKLGKLSKAIGVLSVGVDVVSGVYENIKSGATAKEFISDGLVDIGISVAEIGTSIAAESLASMAAGAALGSVFPGVGTVVGAVVGFSAGLLITYKVDIEKNDRGRTIRDEVKDDILDKINSYGGAVKLWN